MSHQSNPMKKNLKKWFNSSHFLRATPELTPFQHNDPVAENSLRTELFSAPQMARYGRNLASSHKLSPARLPYYLLKRLNDNEGVITQNCYLLNAGKKTTIMPAGEWLLDNYYLIEEQIRLVRHHLPKNFGKGLPALASPRHCPRIYDIAAEAIAHGDGRWDAANLNSYISAYQQETSLTLGEVWALPGMLRLALIENLRRVSIEVVKAQQERDLADSWITRFFECAETTPANLIMVLADMARSRPALSNAFVAELVRRLQGRGNVLVLPLTWIEQRLAEQGDTTDALIERFNQQLAASQLSVSNSIAGLRLVSETNWADFAEAMSVVEQTLRLDPAGIYPLMHFDTRDHYRHIVEILARDSHISEPEVARRLLALSKKTVPDTPKRHIGYYLLGEGRRQLEIQLSANTSLLIRLRQSFNELPLILWLGSLSLLTTVTVVGILHETVAQGAGWLLIMLLAIPLIVAISQLASDLLSEATTRFLTPKPLPRMDFSAGIPEHFATMVVIPCLLTSSESISRLITSLEVCWLGNQSDNLCFALLTDFIDSASEYSAENRVLLDLALSQTQALNRRYPASRPRFYLLHRAPEWNPAQKVWMGYERKRGKLALLHNWLRHPLTQFSSVAEMPSDQLPQRIKYIITLDSDTVLPRDTAHKLVATMAHPLNLPEYDSLRQRVVKGYGILQPGLAEEIPRHGQGRYAALYSSVPGNNPYAIMSSNIYQDLFGEGSFVGKGIYDVDIFVQATENTCPENLVLSHDLLEGCYARSGLLSEVLLYEQYPNNYLTDVMRRTRWIRGDWQLLNWLKLRVRKADGTHTKNPLSALSYWKLFDNLRRSLVPPSLLALLFCSLLCVPNPYYWLSVLALVWLLPTTISIAHALIHKPAHRAVAPHLLLVAASALKRLSRIGLNFVTLPHEAGYSLYAIIVTLWRLGVSQHNLNQWSSYHLENDQKKASPLRFYRAMWLNVACGMALIALTIYFTPSFSVFALTVGILWCLAPLLLSWMSRQPVHNVFSPTKEQKQLLRQTSREIWAFFETFACAKENWLPPDNYQEIPQPVVAHRTSPTNIGLSLLANLTAWDFGYLPIGEVLQRITLTLDSMDKMEHFRGHLYNWYDTRTLAPLSPRYVSSVDSGNMAGHLLTLREGLSAMRNQPILDSKQMLAGLDDTLGILEKHWGPDAPISLQRLRRHCLNAVLLPPEQLSGELNNMCTQSNHLSALCHHQDQRVLRWIARLQHQLVLLCHEWSHLLGWLTPTYGAHALPSLNWLAQAKFTGEGSPPSSAIALARIRLDIITELEQRLNEHAQMDFTFLYREVTSLLCIGYNCDSNMRDKSHYDLLPSEIRLTSFLAIATNQLPLKSWYALGRLFTTIDKETALMSWSGSMFEYLMPNLVMPTWPGSLLDEMSQSAVMRQIDWGKERGVPWGVSESGYHAFDLQKNYKYHAFGVPGLGLRRGLADDMVVAPYATLLALIVSAQKACENLLSLEKNGAHGEYGFYEALDYTPSRLATGQLYAVVQSWMAHHQGMAFQALAHVLFDAPMEERFMSSTLFQSASILLQERVPDAVDLYGPRRHFESHEGRVKPVHYEPRIFTEADRPVPEVQLLSNGHYHLMMTHTGSSYSRWNGLALTRWRSDTTSDNWGAFCYISDPQTGEVWSNTWQPTNHAADSDEVIFTDSGAEFKRTFDTLSIRTQVVVSPEDNIELRRVTLTHHGRKPRTVDLTTYAEVVLAPAASDLAHPSFSNLFIQTELVPAQEAILCHRRPRSPDEASPWLFHMMVVHGDDRNNISFETDRAKFLGRGRSPADALSASSSRQLSNTSGSVLVPILAIRQSIRLQPGKSVTIDIVYGISESRQLSLALLEKYRDHHIADRVFELAWSHSLAVLRQMNANEDDAALFNRLAGAVLYPCSELRADSQIISRNRRGQSGLWGWAISGDLPIVLLSVTSEESIQSITTLIQAHRYWHLKGLAVDLVILNDCPGGYQQALQHQIMDLIYARTEARLLNKSGGIFVRNSEHLSAEDKLLLISVAHISLDDRAGGLNEQLSQRLHTVLTAARLFIPHPEPRINQHRPWTPDTSQLLHFNGYGGFSPDGREYHIVLRENEPTPAPWSNVLANPGFGSVLSEAGQAYSWYENAHEYRLTPWENDPVSDRSGEAFYLRDEESGACWSPTTLPQRGQGDYLSRHGFGYSIFSHRESGIDSELTVLVAEQDPVKLAILTLSNNSGRTRKLSVTGYVEWTLGESRTQSALHVVTHAASIAGGCGVMANNFYGADGGGRTAFFAVTGAHCSVTGDRREFIGRNGSLQKPAAMGLRKLSDKTGAGLDPCGAVQSATTLIDGDQTIFIFVLGVGEDLAQAQATLTRYLNEDTAREELNHVHRYWHNVLDKIVVNTPDTTVNLLVNGWLLYQTIACRLMARSGYYQSGGAFGFRDQLQDTLALSHAAPKLLHKQIELCASRQFIEGDVQHWWHPPLGNGVRTRCSDDYLWLPLAVCHYVETTGDAGVLEQRISYLEGRPLHAGEESIYDKPAISAIEETLWLHCVKAIRHGLQFGQHGLPLMGAGDWNDGMNRVGIEGKGESVWLGFFLYDILQRFANLAEQRQDSDIASLCHREASRLQKNLEASAWDGKWYRRGYFDDGEPLGSTTSQDCRIDAIAQSWSVLSGAANPARSAQAMQALYEHLVENDARLIKLLTPPFDGHGPNPGYIQGYLPGVRENGGQYTHGAIWAVMAFARMGNTARAWQLWSMINPINHALNASDVERYKVEPYVMSADVYSVSPHTGRGGWSWYTGSAGWAYRLLTEELLGIKRHGETITVHAKLPHDWPSLSMTYQQGDSQYHISVLRDSGEYRVAMDGVMLPDDRIPLLDDGRNHTVNIIQN